MNESLLQSKKLIAQYPTVFHTHYGDTCKIEGEWLGHEGLARLVSCCGSCEEGHRTYNSIYNKSIVPAEEKADWSTKDILVYKFVSPDFLPELKTGRSWIRLMGEKKHFLITWDAA